VPACADPRSRPSTALRIHGPGATRPVGITHDLSAPLGYLLGLEGLALLRGFAGAYDHDFTRARLAETRALLNTADRLGDGAAVAAITTSDAYDNWSASYDEPGNGLIDVEQPLVRTLIDDLPVGVALDAACGTGRRHRGTWTAGTTAPATT
jgi:hypothetical protein